MPRKLSTETLNLYVPGSSPGRLTSKTLNLQVYELGLPATKLPALLNVLVLVRLSASLPQKGCYRPEDGCPKPLPATVNESLVSTLARSSASPPQKDH